MLFSPYRNSVFLLVYLIIFFFIYSVTAQHNPPGLGFLNGETSSSVYDISPDGSAISGTGIDQAIIWTDKDGMVGIGQLSPGFPSSGRAVSDDGRAVAGHANTSALQQEAFLWTEEAGMQGLGFLPGDNNSYASDISADGLVVAGYSNDTITGSQGFRWTEASGIQGLSHISGGITSMVNAISADGRFIVGGSYDGTNSYAVRWDSTGSPEIIGQLPGRRYAEAIDVSSDGSVIMGISSGNGFPPETFRWTDQTGMQGLGIPEGASSSIPKYMSEDGSVIIAIAGVNYYFWDEVNGFREWKTALENDYGYIFTGWQRTAPSGIVAENGIIKYLIGGGINANGQAEAWRMTLPAIVPWINGSGGIFSDNSNWDGGVAPEETDIALFDMDYYGTVQSFSGLAAIQNDPLSITFDQVAGTAGLTVGDGHVLFDLQEHSYDVGSLWFKGQSGNSPEEAQLQIKHGVLGTTNAVRIGVQNAPGKLIIADDATLEVSTAEANPNNFIIGSGNCDGECGSIVLARNGKVFSDGVTIGADSAMASVLVTGKNSQWIDNGTLLIGKNGEGIVGLIDTVLLNTKELILGQGNDSRGTIDIINESAITSDSLTIGDGGIGEMDISGSIVSAALLEIGIQDTGKVEINNAGTLVSFNKMTIGESGYGELNIFNGKLISFGTYMAFNPGSSGNILLLGPKSAWYSDSAMSIGFEGRGSLVILAGAKYYQNHLLTLATINGSQAYLEVGSDSSLAKISNQAIIGFHGTATVLVRDSGFVRFDSTTWLGVNRQGEGEILVRGHSTKLWCLDTLYVGYEGRGGISATEGGLIDITKLNIGEKSGSIGSALIDGDSSLALVHSLYLGNNGTGFMRVINNGTLLVSKMKIGNLGSLDSTGTVIIGSLVTPEINSLNKKLLAANRLTADGAVVQVDTLLLAAGAQISADSVIFADGGYLGSADTLSFDIYNSGAVNPGGSLATAGTFTVDANYTQFSSGKLFIELGGLTAGEEYDRLVISGDAELAGTLHVSRINNFIPEVGQSYVILNAENISGTFEQIISSGMEVDVTYNPDNVTIEVTSVSAIEEKDKIPDRFYLYQNYPNPFNPKTTISYQLATNSDVQLAIYNILGQKEAALVNKKQPAGSYQVEWDASGFASGIYYYHLKAGEFEDVKKMILIK